MTPPKYEHLLKNNEEEVKMMPRILVSQETLPPNTPQVAKKVKKKELRKNFTVDNLVDNSDLKTPELKQSVVTQQNAGHAIDEEEDSPNTKAQNWRKKKMVSFYEGSEQSGEEESIIR